MTVTTNFDENTVPDTDTPVRPLVSVIVLAYGNSKYVDACLATVAQQVWSPLELIFVDNASPDDSAEVARRAVQRLNLPGRVLALPRNLGCAGGNNAGWQAAQGDIVVFLNPDTELRPDCISHLVEPLLQDGSIGVTGAKMYFPGGSVIQHAGGIVYPNGMTNHYGAGREDNGQWDELRDVDYVTGAAMAMRRDLIKEIGGFDEDYFPAYYEEVDLCLRVRRAGKRVVYQPEALLVHHESVSVGRQSTGLHRLFPRMRIRYLLKNLTLRQLLFWAIPFEIQWMLHEPAAKGYRWYQVRYGWMANVKWALQRLRS